MFLYLTTIGLYESQVNGLTEILLLNLSGNIEGREITFCRTDTTSRRMYSFEDGEYFVVTGGVHYPKVG